MKPINLQVTVTAHDTAGLIQALDATRAAVAAGHLNHASCHDVMNTPGAYLLEVNLPPGHPVAYRVPGGQPMTPEDALTHLGAVQADGGWTLENEVSSMEDLLDDLVDEEKLELVLPAGKEGGPVEIPSPPRLSTLDLFGPQGGLKIPPAVTHEENPEQPRAPVNVHTLNLNAAYNAAEAALIENLSGAIDDLQEPGGSGAQDTLARTRLLGATAHLRALLDRIDLIASQY